MFLHKRSILKDYLHKIGLAADNDLDGARAFALVETVSDSCEGKLFNVSSSNVLYYLII